MRRSYVRVVAITTTRKGQSGSKRMPLKKLAISLCDRLEKQVMSWGKDEREEPPFLIENYAPVSEMAPTADLPVVGAIPVRYRSLLFNFLLKVVCIAHGAL